MKKIKVLQFPMANVYGGITQYALQNWRYIDKTRFQFDFATLSKSKLYFENEVTAQGCKVYHISCYAEENEEQFKKEIKAIFKNDYDVVHLHTSYWKSFLVEKLAKEAGIPKVIIHAHNSSVLGEDHRKEDIDHHNQCVMQLDESIATDYWACSRLAAKWLYGDRIPAEKIVIQKNAIDVDRFQFQPEIAQKIRKELEWEDKYIIGHVGRFTYQKNHEFLIRVFREVHQQNPDTRLLLVGVGPERKKIEGMIINHNIRDAVQILEYRKDVDQLMQAMNCFAFPSRFEGLGIVLIEAQAAGCDCLASSAVPEEAVLTEHIERLPLIEEIWIKTILKMSKTSHLRYSENAIMVRNAGYDLKDQIKRIEEGYMS